MNYDAAVKASEAGFEKNEYLLLFYKDEVMVKGESGIWQMLTMKDVNILHIETTAIQYIGELNGSSYYGANIADKPELPGFDFIKLRQLSQHAAREYWAIAFRAYHVMNWLKNNRYCGRCGHAMKLVTEVQELAVSCPDCSNIVYPRISPAIIVAVLKDDRILLAHSSRFPPGRYSVIAGFVEPGETMENCVRRELQEEVGIEVDNIEYFGSQPWPFPDSLMVAFTASYSSGKITVDQNEILDADWFTAHALPNIPEKGTISRQLIDWFLAQQSDRQAKDSKFE